jgi:hypothetical protein
MMKLARAGGVTVSEMDGDLFLVKPDSGEIYHLDPMAAAIWNAANEPISRGELLDLFREAFPEQAIDAISGDLEKALSPMIEGAVLVETAPD